MTHLSYAITAFVLLPPVFIAFILSNPGREWYDRTILPHFIEFVCSQPPIMGTRHRVVPLAKGKVLEIGIGSGINLPLYTSAITSITGVDPSAAIQNLAKPRISAMKVPVEMIPLELGAIGAADGSFDDIVCTFTLCTIPDPVAALKEMRRVLKPGGRLLFAEHGKSPDAGVYGWQRRLTPYWGKFVGGCHLDRDIPKLIEEGGFTLREVQKGYVEMPKVAGYVYSGWAD